MKNKVVFLLMLGALFAFLLGCDMTQELSVAETAGKAADETAITAKLIKDTGVVRYINLEGGFYGIIGRYGNYDPVNLPKEFKRDGLRVQFSGELLDSMGSIHMWGRIIRLTSIQTTNTLPKRIMDTGVLRHYTIQGGPWVVEASTGSYQILNLPNEYMVENLKVVFCGYIRTDIIIVPALWPLVELYWIEKVPGSPVIVNLREEFKLQVGNSASIPAAGILFSFKSVLQDSRCPSDVVCVWQGEAIIQVNIKIGNVDYGDYKLSTLNTGNTVTVGRYCFQFNNLYPYPATNIRINPNEYVGYFIIYPALALDSAL